MRMRLLVVAVLSAALSASAAAANHAEGGGHAVAGGAATVGADRDGVLAEPATIVQFPADHEGLDATAENNGVLVRAKGASGDERDELIVLARDQAKLQYLKGLAAQYVTSDKAEKVEVDALRSRMRRLKMRMERIHDRLQRVDASASGAEPAGANIGDDGGGRDRRVVERSPLGHPEAGRPQLERPEIQRPQIERPEIERPMVERPIIDR